MGRAFRLGFDRLENFRAFYTRAVCEAQGRHYNTAAHEEPDDEMDGLNVTRKRPINVLAQMLDAYMPAILGAKAQFDFRPKRAGLAGSAIIRKGVANDLAERSDLWRIRRRVVHDTLLSGLGVYFSGVRAGADLLKVSGEMSNPGEWFTRNISLNDITRDPFSRDPLEDTFFGHRFRVPLAYALDLADMGVCDPDVILNADKLQSRTEQASTTAPMGGGRESDDTLMEMIELWNITVWDGRKTLECVIAEIDGGQPKFAVPLREYQGPERGPYHLLSFLDRSDSAQPASVAMRLMDLHSALAAVGTKIVDQILETDTKIIHDDGGKEQAMNMLDRSMKIIAGNPQLAREFRLGGLDPSLIQGFQILMQIANDQGVNLTQTAGRGSDSGTATEASINAGKSAQVVAAFQQREREVMHGLGRRMGWWMDNMAVREQMVLQKIPGGDSIELVYDPESREDRADDYEVILSVDDQQTLDPNMRRLRINEAMIAMPQVRVAIAQSGGDPAAYTRLMAEVHGEPEINDIFPSGEAQMVAQVQAQQAQQRPGPGQPAGVRQPKAASQTPQAQMQSDYSA